MSEVNEKLSIVLDEYPDDAASKVLLDEVIGDVNLQYQMRRYQMIGDIMRHELPGQINLDLTHQIMSEVNSTSLSESADTKVIETHEISSFWNWSRLKPLTGFAVAASVAVVSISLWQSISIESQGQSPEVQVVSVEQKKINQLSNRFDQISAVTASSNLKRGTRWVSVDDLSDSQALQQKLNAYLVNHTESSIPIQGLIPQARVAGFDSQQ